MGDQEHRRQQREAEVAEAVEKLEFMESQGLKPQVSPDGKIGGFIGGPPESGSGGSSFEDAIRVYSDLHQMHKTDREREILIEAWERFRVEPQEGD